MRRSVGLISLSAAGLVLAIAAGAAQADPEFSADVVQQGGQGSSTTGKLYVSNAGTRTEFSQQGQQMIQVVNKAQGALWMVYPDQKSYMERKGPAGGFGTAPQASGNSNPCSGMQGVSCQKQGNEAVAGRAAVKWEMVGQQQGKTVRMTLWLDAARGFPLRQELPDGGKNETRMLRTENYEGRTVEVWETVMTDAKGQSQRSERWYDPGLDVAVKEVFPGGYGRELHNIRVGPQPASLFASPAASGFKLIEIPAGGGQDQSGAGDEPSGRHN